MACMLPLILILSLGGSGSRDLPRAIPSPTLQGIGLSTSMQDVVRRLGQPLRVEELPPETDLGMGELKTLSYAGLTIAVNRPTGAPTFTVYEMAVSHRKWRLSNGLRVGLSQSKALAIFGVSGETSSQLVIPLADRDGRVILTFEGASLASIRLVEDWS
jgi:hypothetical protein